VEIVNHCGNVKMVTIADLKPHPRNPNKHSKAQIDRLAQILEFQGWRYPIKVSTRTGFITSGHGRLMAAKKLGLKSVPVSYQNYENDDQEMADIVSDNAIASWSDLDFAAINAEIANFDPSFDLDLLGIEKFALDPLPGVPAAVEESDHLACPFCHESAPKEQFKPA
jgi:ParB-like chromosome segregation protein Spo0J